MHRLARSVSLLVVLAAPAAADVPFSLTGSLTTASAPFSLADPVSGTIVVTDAAAVAGNVSVDPADVVSYSFTIGNETWAGTGADFAGPFQFTISLDGSTLTIDDAGGSLESTPGGFFLDVVSGSGTTNWYVLSLFNPLAIASDTMSFALGATSSGSVDYDLGGALTSASAPFQLSDGVSGTLEIDSALSLPGSASLSTSDVVSYSFTIGTETWSGTGADLGAVGFGVSADGRTLSLDDATLVPASTPGGYFLSVVAGDWIVDDGMAQLAGAVGTMSFDRPARTLVLQGSLTTAQLPFNVNDLVHGSLVVDEDATAPSSLSSNPFDVLTYQLSIGTETWTGNAGNFVGDFSFQLDGSGDVLTLLEARGFGLSSPNGFTLEVATGGGSTSWEVRDSFVQYAEAVDSFSFVPAIAFRNAGTNPVSYVLDPVQVGGTFHATVDNNVAGQVASVLIAFFDPFSLTLANGQTLLCFDLSGFGEIFTGSGLAPTSSAGGVDTYLAPVPADQTLINIQLFSQAIQFGAPPFALSNAQDMILF